LKKKTQVGSAMLGLAPVQSAVPFAFPVAHRRFLVHQPHVRCFAQSTQLVHDRQGSGMFSEIVVVI
jgi:hypothetical protein